MKRFLLLFLALTGVITAMGSNPPQFSAPNDTIWHYILFDTSHAALQDNGIGKKATTAARNSKNSQKWAFWGTPQKMKVSSKDHHYLSFQNGRFITSQQATQLSLVQIGGAWEIHRFGESNGMNPWGGSGIGKELGEWTAGDANNALNIVPCEMPLPQFSSISSPVYYFLQFCNGKGCLQGKAINRPLETAKVENAPEQQWLLKGDKNNFQLINANGQYVNIANQRLVLSQHPYAKGFSLQPTENTIYSPAWEIHANGLTGNNTINQWGGAGIGKELGFWQPNDANNPLLFIMPAAMEYPDFKVFPILSSKVQLPSPLTLWYTLPSTLMPYQTSAWKEYALPIGNGQLGACLLGGVKKDEIQFNEKTLWSGKSSDNGSNYGRYENFGSVIAEDISGKFDFNQKKAVHNYLRTLDIEHAIGEVSFTDANHHTRYQRQYLASHPDKVIVAKYSASEPGNISLRFTLQSGEPGIVATTTYKGDEAFFSGHLQTIDYHAQIKVTHQGGTLTTTAQGIEVKNADEVILYLTAGTDFDAYSTTYKNNSEQFIHQLQNDLHAAAHKGWDKIKTAHENDFQHYFSRVQFHLDNAVNNMPTNELVDNYAKKQNEAACRMLEQLYFAYGRYLAISSSRGVDLPSNLQGIWNNSSHPAWNADIHANINVQMNYWPVETTNLSELHLPFCNYIINMSNSKQWQKYARDAKQTIGWTCYTENNIFGGVGGFAQNYVIANAWYVTHLWQHYRFTLDKTFLRKAFPTMWSASQFWMQRMKKGKDGTWECPNEYSPEHGISENAVAHAQQIMIECLRNTYDAAQVLGKDAPLSKLDLKRLSNYIRNADQGLATEIYDGKWGIVNGIKKGDVLLKEWKYSPYSIGEKGHRHLSHLMGLYPFSQITPSSPYFKAAVNSLQMRGNESSGWSMGWKINLWARALDGNHAHQILSNALQHCNPGSGGIFYNLFDVHPSYIFQIDGNFGACAGIAEMLLQSGTDTLHILPALPDCWKNGQMTGLRAAKGFEVDIHWKKNKPQKVLIQNLMGQPLVVRSSYIQQAHISVNGKDIHPKFHQDWVAIPCQKGDSIVMIFDGNLPPTGIETLQNQQSYTWSLSNHLLTIKGKDIENLNLYNLDGKKIAQAPCNQIRIPSDIGHMVVVEVHTTQGKSHFKLPL